MRNFSERLEDTGREKGTMLCFGMDPVVERMNIDPSNPLADEIVRYFSLILHAIKEQIAAVKPNVAYYLQYGSDGMAALMRLVELAGKLGLPVIIDAKSSDIGRTSKAYAKFLFEVMGADAVTLNPYMGEDALEPFFSYKEKGFFILTLTSNPGAGMIQLLDLESGEKLYRHVLGKICSWNRKLSSIGAVIGATQEEFERCISALCDDGSTPPLLVPGVGAQGGSYNRIREILEKYRYPLGVVRINASSAIAYAHENFSGEGIAEAAFHSCDELLKS